MILNSSEDKVNNLTKILRQCPDFKVARLALRGAAGRSATRPTRFGHCQCSCPLAMKA
jgi:hypothetical protein